MVGLALPGLPAATSGHLIFVKVLLAVVALAVLLTGPPLYAGRHAWPYWQRELHRSLPMLLSAIGAGTMGR